MDLEVSRTKKEPEFHALLAQARRYTGMARADAVRKRNANDMDIDEFGNPRKAPNTSSEQSNPTASYPTPPYPPPSYPAPGYGWQGPIWDMNQWDPWDGWNSWGSCSWNSTPYDGGYENWGGQQDDGINALKGNGKTDSKDPTLGTVKNVD